VNQHLGGQIEICDAFWPYEKVRPSTKPDTTLAGYVQVGEFGIRGGCQHRSHGRGFLMSVAAQA
jgi:hypothetical protein